MLMLTSFIRSAQRGNPLFLSSSNYEMSALTFILVHFMISQKLKWLGTTSGLLLYFRIFRNYTIYSNTEKRRSDGELSPDEVFIVLPSLGVIGEVP